MKPFVPLWRNPHFLTIAGHYWPRPFDPVRFPVERKLYRTEPDVQVLVQSQRPAGPARADVVLVHGLEGSADGGYMRSMSHLALQNGFAVHRLNLRTCGGTESLCQTLYHGGLTGDLLAVLRALQAEGRGPVWLIGFSLGGNLVAKLAGELGEAAPPLIAGICAASAAIDLGACARRIHQPDNRAYERRFLDKMRSRVRATGRFPHADISGPRTVFEFDDRITAPSFGFEGAEHYYRTQSAILVLHQIRVPSLFITAKDDTFVPFAMFDHPAFRENPHLHLVATDHGGHLGFLARRRPRFWLDHAIMEWLLER